MLIPAEAVGADEFAAALDRLGPFERSPVLAVGVSGGADSLALTLLADRWARAKGGRVVAVTVDHGLRAEAAAEAARVGQWLAARSIAHHVLEWQGAKPATGIQAAARRARYDLLDRWCGQVGILHLLLAHHQDDQAETVLSRLARGSGVDGLSAMAAIAEAGNMRLLRPLLDVPHARLVAVLAENDQPWIEDPSNQSRRYQRVRLRRALAEEGIEAGRLARTAMAMARARACLEALTAEALVASITLHGAGYVDLDRQKLFEFSVEVQLRVLSAVTRTVGGRSYPSRMERLERLRLALSGAFDRRRTFAGCVLAPLGLGVLVCREARAMAGPVLAPPGEDVIWDGRYRLRLGGRGASVGALGPAGWLAVKEKVGRTCIPAAVRPTLPAVFDSRGIVCVPHLAYERGGAGPIIERLAFSPTRPLAPVGHCLV